MLVLSLIAMVVPALCFHLPQQQIHRARALSMHFEESLTGNTLLAKEALKAERYIATNRFRVRPNQEAKFEKRWADRKSRLSQLHGFRFFTLLKRTEVLGADYSQEGEEGNYVSLTVWDTKDDFDAWRTGDAFKEAHGGGKITDFIQLIGTALFILNGKPKPAFYDAILPLPSTEKLPFTHPAGWRNVESDGVNLLPTDVFVSQNRFRVAKGKHLEFEAKWKDRESSLATVPGFLSFYMLRRDADKADDGFNFISTSIWKDMQSFKDWQSSASFAAAHSKAGQGASTSIYDGPPRVAFFEGKLALSSELGA